METDSQTLPVDALNERRRRALKMRPDGTRLKDTAAQCEMSGTILIAAVEAYESGGWMAVEVDHGGRPVGRGAPSPLSKNAKSSVPDPRPHTR